MSNLHDIDSRCEKCQAWVKGDPVASQKASREQFGLPLPNDCAYTIKNGKPVSNCPRDKGLIK